LAGIPPKPFASRGNLEEK
jgi:hypothetical protein